MESKSLLALARRYLGIIDQMERTHDKEQLQNLEEQRVIWHNRFMTKLMQEGIVYKDRDHATRIASRIVKGEL